MTVSADILRTYRAPRTVLRALLARGRDEARAGTILMAACGLVFVSQWPRLSREAYLSGQELDVLLGGALLAWVFVAPLLLYVLAAISALVLRLAVGRVDGYAARLALFWALLAVAPLWLLHGALAGLLGGGAGVAVIGALALTVFLWFWIAGLLEAVEAAA